jgi:hypothetical protein
LFARKIKQPCMWHHASGILSCTMKESFNDETFDRKAVLDLQLWTISSKAQWYFYWFKFHPQNKSAWFLLGCGMNVSSNLYIHLHQGFVQFFSWEPYYFMNLFEMYISTVFFHSLVIFLCFHKQYPTWRFKSISVSNWTHAMVMSMLTSYISSLFTWQFRCAQDVCNSRVQCQRHTEEPITTETNRADIASDLPCHRPCFGGTQDQHSPINPMLRSIFTETGPQDFSNHLRLKYPSLVSHLFFSISCNFFILPQISFSVYVTNVWIHA